MLKRVLTACLLIPPALYLIGWSPEWLFLPTVAIAMVLALREYFSLCRAAGFKVFSWIGYVASLLLCLLQALPKHLSYPAVVALLVVLLLFIPTFALKRGMDLTDYLAAVAATIYGILYIGLSLSFLAPIRFPRTILGGAAPLNSAQPHQMSVGSHYILLLFLVLWAGDSTAYLVGRPMGRIPFFARISPRKTWEGALAGLAGSVLAGWAYAHWFFKTADVKTVILISAWIAVAGQIGDLVESAIKRGANQKDSGTLLPGHGGFLDRIDSLLFAAPALWLAISLVVSSPASVP